MSVALVKARIRGGLSLPRIAPRLPVCLASAAASLALRRSEVRSVSECHAASKVTLLLGINLTSEIAVCRTVPLGGVGVPPFSFELCG